MKLVLPVPRGPKSATCVPPFSVSATRSVNGPRDTPSRIGPVQVNGFGAPCHASTRRLLDRTMTPDKRAGQRPSSGRLAGGVRVAQQPGGDHRTGQCEPGGEDEPRLHAVGQGGGAVDGRVRAG